MPVSALPGHLRHPTASCPEQLEVGTRKQQGKKAKVPSERISKLFYATIKARDLLVLSAAVKAGTLHPSCLAGLPPGDVTGSVTSGCLEDPAAAVEHGTGHHQSIKPQLVAGEHRFNPHGGRPQPRPARGRDPDLGKGERRGRKTRSESSPALVPLKHPELLLLLPSSALWASLEAKRKEKRVTPGAEPRGTTQVRRGSCKPHPGARIWGSSARCS